MESALSYLFSKLTKRFIMTDVNVQFFSHLNGLTLGNNWGDLIRLLDTCLVNGKPLPSIILQNVDPETADITLEFSAEHSCLLLQVVELIGFSPNEVNGKYRIKGTPTQTTLVLKAVDKNLKITTVGTAKISSLGYDIIFRDEADVKRVYRSKNPTKLHPYIRVDETISNSLGSYPSNYAKYAMVGLLESMEHIDDYENLNVLQLPYTTEDLSRNWSITGSGGSCVRGLHKWYWTSGGNPINSNSDSTSIATGNRFFTLVGDSDAFYLNNSVNAETRQKTLQGAGIFDSCLETSLSPPWFLMSNYWAGTSSTSRSGNYSTPLGFSEPCSRFFIPGYNTYEKLVKHSDAFPLVLNYLSGGNSSNSLKLTGSIVNAITVPFYDNLKIIRGNLKHVLYAACQSSPNVFTTPLLVDGHMYVWDTYTSNDSGGYNYYLGKLE